VNDLGTVLVLGLMFAPFTWRTALLAVACVAAFLLLPVVTPHLVNHYANRTAAFRTKWVLFILFGLGALAPLVGQRGGSAGVHRRDGAGVHPWHRFRFVRRLRTLTIGFLTPIYFLRAGSLVSVPALLSAPLAFLALFAGKVGTKIFGLYPVIGAFEKSGTSGATTP